MIRSVENPHGGDIYAENAEFQIKYDFSSNVSPLGTPDKVKHAVREAAERMHQYPDPYCRKLLKTIAGYEKVAEINILCGNGASELIYSFVEAVKPAKALVVVPTFCEYEAALINRDCEIIYYYLNSEDEFELNADITDYMDATLDAVFLCNPNNPTAKAYSSILMKAIAEKCRECDIYFCVDECFCDLSDAPDKYTMIHEIKNNNKIFILKAFTKSYGMAGIRLGYGICSDITLLEKISRCLQTWNVSGVAQAAGIAALSCKEFLTKNVGIINKERFFITSELKRLGYKVIESHVNFILFRSEKELAEMLLESGILIRKCDNFTGLDVGYYRCAVKCHDENIKLIEALEYIGN